MKKRFYTYLMILVLTALTGFASPAFSAYDATSIFGDNREVYRKGNTYLYRFPFRGGFITYNPRVGSYWKKNSGPGRNETLVASGSGPAISKSRPLPNGCLVYACARSEQIRKGAIPGATMGQAVAFQRTDGSGHAFVVYNKDGRTYAEDDRGLRVAVTSWSGRTADQALQLARHFSRATYTPGMAQPANAHFVGEF